MSFPGECAHGGIVGWSFGEVEACSEPAKLVRQPRNIEER